MYKHYANFFSWFGTLLSIPCLVLIFNKIIPVDYIAVVIILSGILDIFDGKIARKFLNDPKDFIFGELTDSLCDIINFGFLPMLYLILLNQLNVYIVSILAMFYLWCGLFRLARFSRNKTTSKVTSYQGLPIAVAGPLVTLLIFLISNQILLSLSILVISVTMISNIGFKKI